MSVIITKNKTVFYCNTCNNTLSGGNFVAMQQIIFNCGWVILPNKNCYCDKDKKIIDFALKNGFIVVTLWEDDINDKDDCELMKFIIDTLNNI